MSGAMPIPSDADPSPSDADPSVHCCLRSRLRAWNGLFFVPPTICCSAKRRPIPMRSLPFQCLILNSPQLGPTVTLKPNMWTDIRDRQQDPAERSCFFLKTSKKPVGGEFPTAARARPCVDESHLMRSRNSPSTSLATKRVTRQAPSM